MPTIPLIDAIDLTDDHARLDVGRAPDTPDRLGCRLCGLPAQKQHRAVVHRLVRRDLPSGALDETGDELALRRRTHRVTMPRHAGTVVSEVAA